MRGAPGGIRAAGRAGSSTVARGGASGVKRGAGGGSVGGGVTRATASIAVEGGVASGSLPHGRSWSPVLGGGTGAAPRALAGPGSAGFAAGAGGGAVFGRAAAATTGAGA